MLDQFGSRNGAAPSVNAFKRRLDKLRQTKPTKVAQVVARRTHDRKVVRGFDSH